MKLQFKFLSKKELKDRLTQYIVLYKSGFTANIDQNEVMHRYFQCPYGDALICVAEDLDAQNALVAFTAALPIDVACGKEKISAALIMNIVTAPDYRGKGIFVQMIKNIEAELVERGFDFACVFPHYTTNRAFISRLGWSEVDAIPTFALNIAEDSNRLPCDDGDIKEAAAESAVGFENEKIHFEKSAEYLAWRYPTDIYKTFCCNDSTIILKSYNAELNMVELVGKSLDNKEKLLSFAVNYARKNGYKKLSCFTDLNSELQELLEKYGFVPSSPVRFFAVKPLKNSGCDDICDRRNWSISMGDHNAY